MTHELVLNKRLNLSNRLVLRQGIERREGRVEVGDGRLSGSARPSGMLTSCTLSGNV